MRKKLEERISLSLSLSLSLFLFPFLSAHETFVSSVPGNMTLLFYTFSRESAVRGAACKLRERARAPRANNN